MDFSWIEFWGFWVWRLACDDIVEDDEGHEEEEKDGGDKWLWFTIRYNRPIWSYGSLFKKK